MEPNVGALQEPGGRGSHLQNLPGLIHTQALVALVRRSRGHPSFPPNNKVELRFGFRPPSLEQVQPALKSSSGHWVSSWHLQNSLALSSSGPLAALCNRGSGSTQHNNSCFQSASGSEPVRAWVQVQQGWWARPGAPPPSTQQLETENRWGGGGKFRPRGFIGFSHHICCWVSPGV